MVSVCAWVNMSDNKDVFKCEFFVNVHIYVYYEYVAASSVLNYIIYLTKIHKL